MRRDIKDALREVYEHPQRGRKKASVDELLQIAKRVSEQAKGPFVDHADLLYDEHGLPK